MLLGPHLLEAGDGRRRQTWRVPCLRRGRLLPTRAASASSKSPLEMPFRWRTGISTSRLFDRRAYGGTIEGKYQMRSPSVASRSRTRGWRTATGPMPVMISRCGRWPWRTTRRWPVSVFRSACFARNSATSASTAWVSSARAPLRSTSVRESVKAPGWASLITLLSDTAYHSFIGEVEALNTTTIRRLTPSRRHQLLAIAHDNAILKLWLCAVATCFLVPHHRGWDPGMGV